MSALEGRQKGWLSGYRCLDLTDEKGCFCGWILGSLGVDVIKVEKPGGDSSRRLGPFYHDIPHPEKSLFWFANNSNKRSITLNLESKQGQSLFCKLVAKTDFVLESFSPGYLDNLGLGYSSLSQINPQVIMVSITPFGQSGPYYRYKSADIVVNALSGLLYLYGTPERPPVKTSGIDTAYPVAAADGAIGALVALYFRELIGEGQHVDVSAQESLVMCNFNIVPLWLLSGLTPRRTGEYRSGLHGAIKRRQLWHCRDGEVVFTILSGREGARGNRALVEWMESQGAAEQFLLEIDWNAFDIDSAGQELIQRIEEPIGRFFPRYTKGELYEEAVKRGIQLCPVNSAKDIYESPQLEAREFWTEIEHPELGTSITYPGPFFKATEECCEVWHRAPLIGEHNQEVYGHELGLSEQEILCLNQAGVI